GPASQSAGKARDVKKGRRSAPFSWTAARLHAVGRFAVRGGIETFALVFLAHAQADSQIDHLVGDGGDDTGPEERGDHAFELDPELRAHAGVAHFAGDPVLDQ